MTTRERKIEFIKQDGGESNLRRKALALLIDQGADWLTDEQIDEIYHVEAMAFARRERMDAENRQLAASARRGRDGARL